MVNQSLLNFIKNTLALGYNESEIRSGLLKKGWPTSEIDLAFNELKPKIQPEQRIEKPTISEQELKQTLSQPRPSFLDNFKDKFSFKGTTLTIVSFIGILLVLSFTILVFYYMTGLMDYRVLDPATGNLVSGKCFEEDCSDMKQNARDSLTIKEDNMPLTKLNIALLIGLIGSLLIVLVYKFIPWKTQFLWTINIIYFLFLATIIFLWIRFTASLS